MPRVSSDLAHCFKYEYDLRGRGTLGDHLSDLNKTLARHKIGNTKWLARATHSDTRRNFPGQRSFHWAVRAGADTAGADRDTGAGDTRGSQTEDTEAELTIHMVHSEHRHPASDHRQSEEQ